LEGKWQNRTGCCCMCHLSLCGYNFLRVREGERERGREGERVGGNKGKNTE